MLKANEKMAPSRRLSQMLHPLKGDRQEYEKASEKYDENRRVIGVMSHLYDSYESSEDE